MTIGAQGTQDPPVGDWSARTPPQFERAMGALAALKQAGAIDGPQAERLAYDLFKRYKDAEWSGRDSSPLNLQEARAGITKLLDTFEKSDLAGRYKTLDTAGRGMSDARAYAAVDPYHKDVVSDFLTPEGKALKESV